MTQEGRSWLPRNATAPRSALAAIGDSIEAWSNEWLAEVRVVADAAFARVADPRSELRNRFWHSCDGGLAIGATDTGLATLGAAVLSLSSRAGERTEADGRLFEQVGTECLTSLKQRLASLFGFRRDTVWTTSEATRRAGAAHQLAISASELGNILILELSEELFVRHVKAHLPPAPRPRPLGAPKMALASLPIELSAALGRCGISVAELSGLAVGDVLVLDRSLDTPVPLALGYVPLAKGACRIARTGKGLSLELTQSPIG